jgi:hypothetical protein
LSRGFSLHNFLHHPVTSSYLDSNILLRTYCAEYKEKKKGARTRLYSSTKASSRMKYNYKKASTTMAQRNKTSIGKH